MPTNKRTPVIHKDVISDRGWDTACGIVLFYSDHRGQGETDCGNSIKVRSRWEKVTCKHCLREKQK